MDWLEVGLIAVWVVLATFLAGLRLAAGWRRRTATGDSLALTAWTPARRAIRRRSRRADSPNGPTTAGHSQVTSMADTAR